MTGTQAQAAAAIKAEWRDLQARHAELTTVKLVFNGRLKSRLGQCKFTRTRGPDGYSPWRPAAVEVAKFVLNEPVKAMDTFLHEVAHALAGREANHGPRWKEWAVTLGADPTRCGSVAEEHRPAFKYTGTCQDCGREHGRHRKSKVMTGGYVCGECRGRLVWTDSRGRVVNTRPARRATRPGDLSEFFGF